MPSRTAKAKSARSKPYHHGDLKRALLDASLGMLNEPGGANLLTLREVARRAGVSHAAPYRHFPSKEALIAEVAEEGFKQLRVEMLTRAEPFKDDPLRAHEVIGVGYVMFAVGHPAHFRVMFGADLAFEISEGLSQAGQAAFAVNVESVIRCQQAGLMRPGDPMELAVSSWAVAHGLAQLIIDGRLVPTGFTAQQAEALAASSARDLVRGLAVRPEGR